MAEAARRDAELPKAVRDYIKLCSGEAGRAADDGADDNKAYNQAAEERGDRLREAAAHAQDLMRSIRKTSERYIMQAVVDMNKRLNDPSRIRLLPRGAGAGAGVGAGAGAGAEAPADAPRVDFPPVLLEMARAAREVRGGPPRSARELSTVPLPPLLRAAVNDRALSALGAHVGKGDDEMEALLQPPPPGFNEALLRRATAAAEASRGQLPRLVFSLRRAALARGGAVRARGALGRC